MNSVMFSLEILFYLFVSSTGCDEFCDVFPSRSSSICLSVALVVMNSVMFFPRDPLLPCLSVALVVMNSVMFFPRDPLLSVCQ